MYAESKHFEKEFITRTKEIVQNYVGDYNTTLFINAMLALFIVPKETNYDKIDDTMIDTNTLIKARKHCRDKTKTEPLSLQYIVRRIRNAIAHGHILFEAEKDPYGNIDNEIRRVSFFDDRNSNNIGKNYNSYEFKARFSISDLKEFVFAFADSMLVKMGEEK